MDIILYYFFWFFINLDLLALGSLVLGLVFLILKKCRKALTFFVLGAVPLIFINFSPFAPWMFVKFENRIPRPKELPDHVDGLILLGGSFSLLETKERGEPVYNMAGTRIYQFIELAKKFPHAKIISTGNVIESEWTEKIFLEEGIQRHHIVIETDSRTTQDHAVFLKKLIDPKGTYILVTSAFHMPRAVGLFRKEGFNIIPYPVDYHTPGKMSFTFWFAQIRQRITPMAFKQVCTEWAGLTNYYLLGDTNEFFPK